MRGASRIGAAAPAASYGTNGSAAPGHARPRLLFLAQTLPYPPDGGVKIRTYHVLRLLARTFDVTALCFYRVERDRHRGDVARAVDALERFARVEAFPIPQQHNRVRMVWDHARSLVARRAYTVFTYESADFRERLGHVLSARSFDVVHMDSLDLSPYLGALGSLPVVCTHHDIQSVLLARRASIERAPWLRAYVAQQARLMRDEEIAVCSRVALNVTVSQVDRATLERLVPGARATVVPNGVDTDFFRPLPETHRNTAPTGIVSVGGTNWLPNRDSLEYFCHDILPRIRALGETSPVTWVGRASSAEREAYAARHGVELTGYVDDVRPYVHRAACYVVPIRAGGGTRVKILDAWAMGKAVVSTSVGCEGLGAIDGHDILIRDDPAEFAEAVTEVLRNPELRRHLGANARRTAVERFDWDVVGRAMADEYLALAGTPA
ncbi:MAG TPA: glycosyltransferase [Longimicrobiales bacterium]|nr:glycosyltransferase [Longimicrobiales bacterium]